MAGIFPFKVVVVSIWFGPLEESERCSITGDFRKKFQEIVRFRYEDYYNNFWFLVRRGNDENTGGPCFTGLKRSIIVKYYKRRE